MMICTLDCPTFRNIETTRLRPGKKQSLHIVNERTAGHYSLQEVAMLGSNLDANKRS